MVTSPVPEVTPPAPDKLEVAAPAPEARSPAATGREVTPQATRSRVVTSTPPASTSPATNTPEIADPAGRTRITPVTPARLAAGLPEREARVVLKAYEVLTANRMTLTDRRGRPQTFATPSLCTGQGDSHLDYGGKQWLWDSAAHTMILALTEPEAARAELEAVFAYQNLDPTSPEHGFVPHMNYFRGDGSQVPGWARPHLEAYAEAHPELDRESFVNTYWSQPDHSDITQPPILAMAALEVFRATGDSQFLHAILPRLTRYYDWLGRRRADADGLVRIIHPWESGWDNSQRWDRAMGVPAADRVERNQIDVRKMALFCQLKAADWDPDRSPFQVKPVDFNALYARNLGCLAELCRAAGDLQAAKRYETRTAGVARAIFDKMWDGDRYVDLVGEQRSDVKSAAMFYPMLLPGEPHGAELMARHLANPKEFNPPGGCGVPTTALDGPRVDPDQYWRGNVWVIANFFVWAGLQQRLREHPGDLLAASLARQVQDSTFRVLDRAGFYEYFNPGGPCSPDGKPRGFGVPSFGWNGLAVRMLHPPAFLAREAD